jgi:hypothetical protein
LFEQVLLAMMMAFKYLAAVSAGYADFCWVLEVLFTQLVEIIMILYSGASSACYDPQVNMLYYDLARSTCCDACFKYKAHVSASLADLS